MKLAFAAPASFLPSEPTALVSQASWLHFFMNEVLAAPASGLPSLPTALASQDASCAKAEPAAKVATMAARIMRFMGVSLREKWLDWNSESARDQALGRRISRNKFRQRVCLVHPPVRITPVRNTWLASAGL